MAPKGRTRGRGRAMVSKSSELVISEDCPEISHQKNRDFSEKKRSTSITSSASSSSSTSSSSSSASSSSSSSSDNEAEVSNASGLRHGQRKGFSAFAALSSSDSSDVESSDAEDNSGSSASSESESESETSSFSDGEKEEELKSKGTDGTTTSEIQPGRVEASAVKSSLLRKPTGRTDVSDIGKEPGALTKADATACSDKKKPTPAGTSEKKSSPASAGPKGKGALQKKPKDQKELDDIDTLLASLSEPVQKIPTKDAKKGGAVAKKRTGATGGGLQAASAGQRAEAPENDLDALLEEFGVANKSEPASEEKPASVATPTAVAAASPVAVVGQSDAADPGPEGETQVSAKTLKNRLKKQKKKQQQQGVQEGTPEKTSPAAKAGPLSAVARLAQQRLLLLQAEQKRQEEEAQRLQELEEARIREEREKEEKLKEEKERKRRAKQEAKERMRREGKPVTAAEKERARRAELARAQLLQQMKINVETLTTSSPSDGQKKKSKAVIDVRKKKKPQPVTVLLDSAGEAVTQSSNVVAPAPHTTAEVKRVDGTTEHPVVSSEPETKPEKVKTWEDLSDWEKSDTEEGTRAGSGSVSKGARPTDAVHIQKKKASAESGTNKTAARSNKGGGASDTESSSDESEGESSASGVRAEDERRSTKKVVKGSQGATAHSGSTQLRNEDLNSAELRSPICCILGHVDTGKTKLLDKIRRTDVQAGEAGGITQQIGATFFPRDALWEQCRKVDSAFDMRVPGLLIIDTPGHESFNNLRARGSSLCDIAILVVDIMHGLEPQTRASIELLRARKCPFLVALNKIDRLYGWVACEGSPAKPALTTQKESVQTEFDQRCNATLVQLAEMGLNCAVWWVVEDVKKTVSVAPTSAITGEGIPDLLYLLVKLTQSVITKALIFREEFQCTILEVKTIDGLGTTIDVVLVSGILFENDKIVVCGMSGPIVTSIRALLTPQPLKELRVKGEYVHHKQIRAAMGVKISANGLEDAVAGTSVLVARNASDDDIERLKDEVMSDMDTIFKSVDRSGIGVYVMASTLGSLEALLHFLETSKIPVFAINIGTVHKLDVKKASVMREKNQPEYSCILAFDVKVDPEAMKEAQTLGVKIFTADIIYHLFDSFNKYVAEIADAKRKTKENEVVFPCVLSIFPNCIFNKKDPIVLGVKVEEGIVKIGTPLCIPDKDNFLVGRIASLEHNKKAVDTAKKGDEIAVKITGDNSIMFGRHFDHTHKLYSRMTRGAIDCLKEFFRDELKKDDWKLVLKLKKIFDIA